MTFLVFLLGCFCDVLMDLSLLFGIMFMGILMGGCMPFCKRAVQIARRGRRIRRGIVENVEMLEWK